MIDLRLAPHCLGQAASFNPSGAICKRCEYSVECAKQTMTRLNTINKTLDVTDIMRTTQSYLDKHGIHTDAIEETSGKMRFATSASIIFDVDMDLSHCGIRARKIATSILKRGINMRADIRRGINNLKGVKPTHLFDIQNHLMKHGRISHQEIKDLVRKEKPNCKDTVISNSASWTAQALVAIGVVERLGDNYVLTN